MALGRQALPGRLIWRVSSPMISSALWARPRTGQGGGAPTWHHVEGLPPTSELPKGLAGPICTTVHSPPPPPNLASIFFSPRLPLILFLHANLHLRRQGWGMTKCYNVTFQQARATPLTLPEGIGNEKPDRSPACDYHIRTFLLS